MRADDSVRIRHMIDAAESAMRFVQGRRRADLDSDEMLCFALTRAVEIIGEAASRVSARGGRRYPTYLGWKSPGCATGWYTPISMSIMLAWGPGGLNGPNAPPYNQFLLQPFINYNFPDGLYLSSSPIITANWKAEQDKDTWTVPLGGGIGKLWRIGKLPVNTQVQAFSNVKTPEYGPNWTLRLHSSFCSRNNRPVGRLKAKG